MVELTLRATPENWRYYSARQADSAFLSFQKKVFERDCYTCRYCGFKSMLYQEVMNVDGNFKNNKLANLVTACCFCAQCFFLESVGMGYGGGTLIHLPEISQTELNSFSHVLFCAITNDTGYKANAQTVYRSLKSRAQAVEEKFGEGTSDPAVFAQMLIDCNVTNKNKNEVMTIFKTIRLLPSRSKFKNQIEHWAASALEELL